MPIEETNNNRNASNEPKKVDAFSYFTKEIQDGTDLYSSIKNANDYSRENNAEVVLGDRETTWEENKSQFGYSDDLDDENKAKSRQNFDSYYNNIGNLVNTLNNEAYMEKMNPDRIKHARALSFDAGAMGSGNIDSRFGFQGNRKNDSRFTRDYKGNISREFITEDQEATNQKWYLHQGKEIEFDSVEDLEEVQSSGKALFTEYDPKTGKHYWRAVDEDDFDLSAKNVRSETWGDKQVYDDRLAYKAWTSAVPLVVDMAATATSMANWTREAIGEDLWNAINLATGVGASGAIDRMVNGMDLSQEEVDNLRAEVAELENLALSTDPNVTQEQKNKAERDLHEKREKFGQYLGLDTMANTLRNFSSEMDVKADLVAERQGMFGGMHGFGYNLNKAISEMTPQLLLAMSTGGSSAGVSLANISATTIPRMAGQFLKNTLTNVGKKFVANPLGALAGGLQASNGMYESARQAGFTKEEATKLALMTLPLATTLESALGQGYQTLGRVAKTPQYKNMLKAQMQEIFEASGKEALDLSTDIGKKKALGKVSGILGNTLSNVYKKAGFANKYMDTLPFVKGFKEEAMEEYSEEWGAILFEKIANTWDSKGHFDHSNQNFFDRTAESFLAGGIVGGFVDVGKSSIHSAWKGENKFFSPMEEAENDFDNFLVNEIVKNNGNVAPLMEMASKLKEDNILPTHLNEQLQPLQEGETSINDLTVDSIVQDIQNYSEMYNSLNIQGEEFQAMTRSNPDLAKEMMSNVISKKKTNNKIAELETKLEAQKESGATQEELDGVQSQIKAEQEVLAKTEDSIARIKDGRRAKEFLRDAGIAKNDKSKNTYTDADITDHLMSNDNLYKSYRESLEANISEENNQEYNDSIQALKDMNIESLSEYDSETANKVFTSANEHLGKIDDAIKNAGISQDTFNQSQADLQNILAGLEDYSNQVFEGSMETGDQDLMTLSGDMVETSQSQRAYDISPVEEIKFEQDMLGKSFDPNTGKFTTADEFLQDIENKDYVTKNDKKAFEDFRDKLMMDNIAIKAHMKNGAFKDLKSEDKVRLENDRDLSAQFTTMSDEELEAKSKEIESALATLYSAGEDLFKNELRNNIDIEREYQNTKVAVNSFNYFKHWNEAGLSDDLKGRIDEVTEEFKRFSDEEKISNKFHQRVASIEDAIYNELHNSKVNNDKALDKYLSDTKKNTKFSSNDNPSFGQMFNKQELVKDQIEFTVGRSYMKAIMNMSASTFYSNLYDLYNSDSSILPATKEGLGNLRVASGLLSSGVTDFSILGFGGTGKTTLMGGLAIRLSAMNSNRKMNVGIIAPNPKLSNNIESQITGKDNIGDVNKKSTKDIQNRDGSPNIDSIDFNNVDYLVIDEAQFISPKTVEALREKAKENNVTIMAMGDSGQSSYQGTIMAFASDVKGLPIHATIGLNTVFRTGNEELWNLQNLMRGKIRSLVGDDIGLPNSKYTADKKEGVFYAKNEDQLIKDFAENFDDDTIFVVDSEDDADAIITKAMSYNDNLDIEKVKQSVKNLTPYGNSTIGDNAKRVYSGVKPTSDKNKFFKNQLTAVSRATDFVAMVDSDGGATSNIVESIDNVNTGVNLDANRQQLIQDISERNPNGDVSKNDVGYSKKQSKDQDAGEEVKDKTPSVSEDYIFEGAVDADSDSEVKSDYVKNFEKDGSILLYATDDDGNNLNTPFRLSTLAFDIENNGATLRQEGDKVAVVSPDGFTVGYLPFEYLLDNDNYKALLDEVKQKGEVKLDTNVKIKIRRKYKTANSKSNKKTNPKKRYSLAELFNNSKDKGGMDVLNKANTKIERKTDKNGKVFYEVTVSSGNNNSDPIKFQADARIFSPLEFKNTENKKFKRTLIQDVLNENNPYGRDASLKDVDRKKALISIYKELFNNNLLDVDRKKITVKEDLSNQQLDQLIDDIEALRKANGDFILYSEIGRGFEKGTNILRNPTYRNLIQKVEGLDRVVFEPVIFYNPKVEDKKKVASVVDKDINSDELAALEQPTQQSSEVKAIKEFKPGDKVVDKSYNVWEIISMEDYLKESKVKMQSGVKARFITSIHPNEYQRSNRLNPDSTTYIKPGSVNTMGENMSVSLYLQQPTQQTVEVAEESPFVSDTAAEKIKMIDPKFALLYKDGTKELEIIIKLAKNDNISLEQFEEILEKLEKC